MQRRTFVKNTSIIAAAAMVSPSLTIGRATFKGEKVKVGFIGVGARGSGTLELAINRDDVLITAICDIDAAACEVSRKVVIDKGQASPKIYNNGPEAYKDLLAYKDVDVVFICTPWEWHTPMSLAALN